jgi:hypothetical protein
LIREPNLGLGFGASISNYGPGLKYYKETDPLPTILRLGLAYQGPTILDQSILLALESDIYTTESLKSLRGGLEYAFRKLFYFRLGYKALEDNYGTTMGLGLRSKSFSLDYATSFNEVFNTSQVALSYRFPGVNKRAYKNKSRYRDQEKNRSKSGKSATTPARKDSDPFMIY